MDFLPISTAYALTATPPAEPIVVGNLSPTYLVIAVSFCLLFLGTHLLIRSSR